MFITCLAPTRRRPPHPCSACACVHTVLYHFPRRNFRIKFPGTAGLPRWMDLVIDFAGRVLGSFAATALVGPNSPVIVTACTLQPQTTRSSKSCEISCHAAGRQCCAPCGSLRPLVFALCLGSCSASASFVAWGLLLAWENDQD